MTAPGCQRCTVEPAPGLLLISGELFVCQACGARHRRTVDPAGAEVFTSLEAPPLVRVRLVRCPRCGSTDAGSDESRSIADITCMRCNACGHEEFVDSWQISFDWNVTRELPEGTGVPPRVAPLDPAQALCAPPPPGPDVWPSLGEAPRAAILQALTALAEARAEAAVSHPGGVSGRAVAEVTRAEQAGEAVRVHFLMDFFIWNAAQSGSDWFDHALHFGNARFSDGQLSELTWGSQRSFHVTEFDEPRYDRAAVRAQVRGEVLAEPG